MTSFTPQGGGETPKALSSRVLVAAYWLFVVLMLATFTANLAAFLTVERMQETVKSLEELNRQSKINYTVMNDSPYLEYFQVYFKRYSMCGQDSMNDFLEYGQR